MREIITEWSHPGSPGGLTIMYFSEATGLETQRSAIAALWDDMGPLQSTAATWAVAASGRLIDDATGTLTGTWTSTLPAFGGGDAEGGPAANSTMILLQWLTSGVVNGRRVRGRTFAPYPPRSAIGEDGQLLPAALTGATAAVNSFLASSVGFSIWHRPSERGPGSMHAVTGGSVWGEFAVQRGRR